MYTAQSMKNQWAQGGALGSLQSGEGARDGGMDEDQDSIKETMLDIYQYLRILFRRVRRSQHL